MASPRSRAMSGIQNCKGGSYLLSGIASASGELRWFSCFLAGKELELCHWETATSPLNPVWWLCSSRVHPALPRVTPFKPFLETHAGEQHMRLGLQHGVWERLNLGPWAMWLLFCLSWASIFLCTTKMVSLINNAGHIIIKLKTIVWRSFHRKTVC